MSTKHYGYRIDQGDWWLAVDEGREQAIRDALADIARKPDGLEVGKVYEFELCVKHRPCLSDGIDGSSLLNTLDEWQVDESGGDFGWITDGWSQKEEEDRAKELEEEVSLAVARWCDNHDIKVPWWEPSNQETVKVCICDIKRGFVNYKEVE
jgi:hypothetical protein